MFIFAMFDNSSTQAAPAMTGALANYTLGLFS